MNSSQPVVEFYFDFGSPTTYFAFHVLQNIAKTQDAKIIWKPVLLGAVFKLSNNATPALHPLKSRWMIEDLTRWSEYWNIPYKPGAVPVSTLHLVRAATYLNGRPEFIPYCTLIFDALWRDGLNLYDQKVYEKLLQSASLEPLLITAEASKQEVKDELTRTTSELVDRGGFGTPTIFVNGEMHFGQDRLEFVEKALSRMRQQ
jgi:2-hydroxychromene-2-carboxylate isomerase